MLHIVLYQPEIPQNTGNIIRTCVGFNAILHLIKPYGFIFSKNNPELKRSGVNYLEYMKVCEHNSWEDFIESIKGAYDMFFLTRYGVNKPSDIKYTKTDTYLVFGKESTGIDKSILEKNKNKTIRIPSTKNVRSLNLSNCVAILAHDYCAKKNYKGLETKEPHKPLFKK
ncbi:MAG: tRNA (uridine(34)/cytosine(34)/5-carboxymethylaminomethyluridine (34)-2'-O)-methyltransferase TrmL [Mycoplasmoidaceae bacterium]|nr:MAG: tRNA (uridine(34)/cytosine(34)/5-carboxymethylaminomethyluridine (34)-2'-O)-methyltransferase TrmL [Mycoplasmoidaceae bacterium]